MLVVDASVLAELVVGGPGGAAIAERMSQEDLAAPHVIDVEVFGVIRREHQRGRLDRTEARQAVEDLQSWPGARYGHRFLLDRAWELRDSVRGWDAMYVALAESLGAPLLTTDGRLAAASGPECEIRVVGAAG
jgi:predicted nucleic acid-binding protein